MQVDAVNNGFGEPNNNNIAGGSVITGRENNEMGGEIS